MKLLVAIPALNEQASIENVIQEVYRSIPEAKVLVIDDGSTDRTSEISKLAGADVIELPFNLGVGGALRVAFRFAKENGFTHVLQVDADGQHLPSEASNLFMHALNNDVVIGSRFNSKEFSYPVGFSRRVVMQVLSKLISFICKTRLTDVTSGFRLTSGEAIALFSKQYPRDYLGDTIESILLANKAGLKVTEVPVQMNQRIHGKPSQNFVKSIWYLVRALLVIFLSTFKSQKSLR